MRHFVGHLSCRFVFVLGTVWIYLFFLSRRWLIVGLIDWWLQPEQFAHTGLSYVYDTAGGPQVEEIEGASEDRQFAFRAFLLMSAKLVALYFFEITSVAAFVFWPWVMGPSEGSLEDTEGFGQLQVSMQKVEGSFIVGLRWSANPEFHWVLFVAWFTSELWHRRILVLTRRVLYADSVMHVDSFMYVYWLYYVRACWLFLDSWLWLLILTRGPICNVNAWWYANGLTQMVIWLLRRCAGKSRFGWVRRSFVDSSPQREMIALWVWKHVELCACWELNSGGNNGF